MKSIHEKIKKELILTNRYEIELIHECASEIANFSKNFNSNKIKKTFIFSPWLSSCFGIEVQDKKLYIGIPEIIYNILSECKIYNVCYIKGKPGIYIVCHSDGANGGFPIAFRILFRESTVDLISRFTDITFVKMDPNNEHIEGYREDYFPRKLKQIKSLYWENKLI